MSKDSTRPSLSVASSFLIVRIVIVLLVGGGLGLLIPSITSRLFAGVEINQFVQQLTTFGPIFWGVVIGATVIAIIVLLRQDELAATAVVALHLYVDLYLGMVVVAQVITLLLLFIFFLARSPRYPWAKPRALWLWGLFLVIAIFPTIHGAIYLYDAVYYYPNIMFGALLIFWLGTLIARDAVCIRRLFKLLAGFGTLIAVHSIIQATTGVSLLAVSTHDAYLASVSNFQLGNAHRAGSFFINPDWDSAFLALICFIPLGLFVERSLLLAKVLYLVETFIILLALLFTYGAGASLAAIAGVVVFVALVGQMNYRIQLCLFIFVGAIVLLVGFPSQINLLIQHGSDPTELALRSSTWQTAIAVIRAFPLTGIGLGYQAYLEHSEPYRVPGQYKPFAHPHNSFLELGAMGGLPVLLLFIALLICSLWWALRNWLSADVRTRALIGGGIAAIVTLTANSFSINAWTLPPLASVGWLILGVISSPLLAKSQMSKRVRTEEKREETDLKQAERMRQ